MSSLPPVYKDIPSGFPPSSRAPPHLQIPSSSCRAPCNGRAGSGPHRYPRGSPCRSPCCWGCRAPRSTPNTRCPSSPSLQGARNKVKDMACRTSTWSHGLPHLPTPAFTPEPILSHHLFFFLATADVTTKRARRARRKKPRCCILGVKPGLEFLA